MPPAVFFGFLESNLNRLILDAIWTVPVNTYLPALRYFSSMLEIKCHAVASALRFRAVKK